jgi:hypothetical protein
MQDRLNQNDVTNRVNVEDPREVREAIVSLFSARYPGAQFSALVTEAVPAHAVGTALTMQTCLGFFLTLISIQLVPPVVESAGWPVAFGMLALGPGAGILAIRKLARMQRAVV